MKVMALVPVMRPGATRRLVPDGKGGQRDAAYILPSDGIVDVPDERYWRRRLAVGDLELVAAGLIVGAADGAGVVEDLLAAEESTPAAQKVEE